MTSARLAALGFLLGLLYGDSAAHAGEESGSVVTYPAPQSELPSPDYEVTVNGQPVFCYTSYQFVPDSATKIAGRPVSPLSFCYFDFEGEVELTVRFLAGLEDAGLDTSSVVIRPLAHDLHPAVRNGSFTFRLREPCQLSIEPGGSLLHPLHVFANPHEGDVPSADDPKVHYFGPGVHHANGIDVKSGETVYIAGGAVVHLEPQTGDLAGKPAKLYGLDLFPVTGLFDSKWQKNVTIRGRGILCGREALERHQRGALIRVQGIDNLEVEGIILRESSVWSLNVVNSKNVHVDNVKVVGHYVNNDGIVIGGTSEALVENCFSHNADDSLEVKVWVPQRNVTFRNCVVWNDLGGSFGLMHETGADIENVAYENCTVIHSTDNMSVCPVVGLKLTGPGSARNFRFENIVIEDVVGDRRPALKVINNWDDWHLNHPTRPDSPYELLMPPKRERPSGKIADVLFKNVNVLNCLNTDVVLVGEGLDSTVEGITFENVALNGRRLVAGDERIKTNEWVRRVVVR